MKNVESEFADTPQTHRSIAILIGTGDPPPVFPHSKITLIGDKFKKRDGYIAALIGWSGEIIVHLYGNWTELLSPDDIYMVFRNVLSRNAIRPRLFIDGAETNVDELKQ